MSERLILAGDVGGTKTNVALFSEAKGPLEPIRMQKFSTQEAESLEAIVEQFLGGDKEHVAAACFGVAGPVDEGYALLVNVPWNASEKTLSECLNGAPAVLINDIVAMAWGTIALPEDRFAVLHAGKQKPGANRALVAAGTGLGQALIVHDGDRWLPIPSEGGHAPFAPVNELEIDMMRAMNTRFGRTSYERMVSGPGLVNIYKFLVDSGRQQEKQSVADRMKSEDAAKVITESALAGTCPLCIHVMEIFLRVYGGVAGNLAITGLALDGIYIGGGIAPKIMPMLESGLFMNGFTAMGRLTQLLSDIPVRVILEPNAPVFGAAYRAMQLF